MIYELQIHRLRTTETWKNIDYNTMALYIKKDFSERGLSFKPVINQLERNINFVNRGYETNIIEENTLIKIKPVVKI